MLNEYCASTSNGQARAWLRDMRGSAENNWLCRQQGRPDRVIDMTAACVREYGKGAVARYTDRNDLTSWRCFSR
ncbi:hypothetical protein [Micromonospora sp. NPDC049679]|uniref:hypothetical protein n=1 Tax=Micromonospora sp. NPDC049679 TaxID=3155920 RepID=UPI0033F3BB19